MRASASRYPTAAVVALVAGASFIPYNQLDTIRLFIGPVPINIIDLLIVAATPTLFVTYVIDRRSSNVPWHAGTVALIAVLSASVAVGAVHGIMQGQSSYNIARGARPVLLLIAAMLLVRSTAQSAYAVRRIFAIVGFAGLVSLLVILAVRVQLELGSRGDVSFLDARTPVPATAAMDVAGGLIPALLVVTRPPKRGALALWLSYGILVASNLLSLTLTGVILALLLPLLSAVAGLMRTPRLTAVLMAAAPFVLVLAIAAGAMNASRNGTRTDLVGQSVAQALSLANSPNFRGRAVSWQVTIDRLGNSWPLGLGLGYREFIETGIAPVGEVLLGEPTVPTMLLATGVLGAGSLVALLIVFAVRAFLLYLWSPAGSLLAAFGLTLSIYGLTITITAFLHNSLLAPQASVLLGCALGLLDVMSTWRSQVDRGSARYLTE